MPWWVWAIAGWIVSALLLVRGWVRFMRPLRDWEDERLAELDMRS